MFALSYFWLFRLVGSCQLIQGPKSFNYFPNVYYFVFDKQGKKAFEATCLRLAILSLVSDFQTPRVKTANQSKMTQSFFNSTCVSFFARKRQRKSSRGKWFNEEEITIGSVVNWLLLRKSVKMIKAFNVTFELSL